MRLLTKTLLILAAALMCSCGESKIEEDIPDVPNSGGTEEQKPSSSSYNEKSTSASASLHASMII